MRPKTPEVLVALRDHAAGPENSVRAGVLARKIGLPPRIVSNALNWLVTEGRNPNVRREREPRASWYKYWWVEKP